jgi:glycosyltransferase involved in cell wall biosynthesis
VTRISIAMATYNGAQYLREQLDSFTRQTRLPDELVVCDDCSSDDTVEILNDFASAAPFRVRTVVNDVNLGHVRNFEKALSLCDGELVFLSDQDDVWFEGKLDAIASYMAQNPRCLAVTNDRVITDKVLNPITTVHTNLRQAGRPLSDHIIGCASAIRRAWLDICLPFPRNLSAEHSLWIVGFADLVGVHEVYDNTLQYYRRHENNFSNYFLFRGRISLWQRFFLDWNQYGLNDARPGWRRDSETFLQYQDRLNERAAALGTLGLQEARLAALEKLALRRHALDARIALLSTPRYRRPLDVASFLRAGGYRQFGGWKSAVKDLVR